MRMLVGVIVVGLVGGAAAAPKRSGKANTKVPASFLALVTARLKDANVTLSRWGTAQLDDDPALEYHALLCNESAGQRVYLIEKPGVGHWEFTRDLDGRNGCEGEAKITEVPWVTKPTITSLANTFAYHGGEIEERVALRGGVPRVVWSRNEEHHAHGDPDSDDRVVECDVETLDYDLLVRVVTVCDTNVTHMSAIAMLDGKSGTHRSPRNSLRPQFAVTTRRDGKRIFVTVRPLVPVQPSERFEVWTAAKVGKPFGWSLVWSGSAWSIEKLRRAPPELPPVKGDATHVEVPILVRDENANGNSLAHLTVVSVSPDGKHRQATSALDPDDLRSMGIVIREVPLAQLPEPGEAGR